MGLMAGPLPPLPPLPPDLGERLEEAAYISVGLGVLAFQQAQVKRRELERLVGRVLHSTFVDSAAPGTAEPTKNSGAPPA